MPTTGPTSRRRRWRRSTSGSRTGRPSSPPPIDAIRAREEVRKALAEGASLMTFAYVPADGKLERVNISMDRGLLRAIDATASARGMTRSAFIAMVARREIAGF
nr:type II toxin-antitoxin system HicB family antitoxin [Cereibacter sphaeroides]